MSKYKVYISVLVLGVILGVISLVVPVFSWDVDVIEFYPDGGKIWLNGEEVPTASPPIIVNNRIYVPIRTVSNLISATITWSATRRVATMLVPNFSFKAA